MTDLAPPPYPGPSTAGTSPDPQISLSDQHRNHIREQCALRDHLIKELGVTEGALASDARQNSYIGDLEAQDRELQTRVRHLRQVRQREEYDFAKYRDSKVGKAFASLTILSKARFEDKAAKEEREYLAALKAEEDATQELESIKSMLAEARKANADVEAQADRNKAAQHQLDNLYASIFDGPTPEAPEEDRLEHALSRRREVCEQATQRKFREETAVRSMKEAELNLKQALSFIEPALKYSNMDRHGYDKAGYTKRDLMHKVEMRYQSAKHSMEIARLSQPLSGDIGVMTMPRTRDGDIRYDNYFGDSNYHQEIKNVAKQLQSCVEKLQPLLSQGQSRLAEVTAKHDQENAFMETARRALLDERARAFEHVLIMRLRQQPY